METINEIKNNNFNNQIIKYSYHGSTLINIKNGKELIDINGKKVLLDSWTRIADLFKRYESEKSILQDCEVINLNNKNIYVRDKNETYTKVIQCLKHKRDTKLFSLSFENQTFNHNKKDDGICGEIGTIIVTANHPMIMANGLEKNANLIKVDDLLKGNGYYSNENYKVTKIKEINSFNDIVNSYQYLTKFDKEQIEHLDDIDKDVEYVYNILTESYTFNVGLLLCKNCY